jgi:predicted PurR-regulated permease PerM
MLFGAMGFMLGPILAALFVTAWEMLGSAFRTALAAPGPAVADLDYRPPADD